MRLDRLLGGIEVTSVSAEPATVTIAAITHDSRAVTGATLFCCVAGRRVDGHRYAAAAVEAGAVAVMCERPVGVAAVEVVVPDVRRAMGPVASAFHGDPSTTMSIVGVTGTNGKTTTVHLLRSVLEAAGRPAAVIGTLTGTRTTPEAPDLQARLAALRDRGTGAVAMEVSSHALVQHRTLGTRFEVAVFTNLSRDHLDFHTSMEEYFQAKARLFERTVTAQAVVNLDDSHGRLLHDAADVPTVGYQLDDATEVSVGVTHSRFRWRGVEVRVPMGGRFNVANALAAATAGAALGIDPETVAAGIGAAGPVPGRFESVEAGQPFRVVVDYAHTPDGIGQVLAAAREVAGGYRVIIVFGAGGDRDRTKRPAMGATAARGADVAVVTSDNPRGEKPDAIIDEIMRGIPDRASRTAEATLRGEVDRRAAIQWALAAAVPGDVVVIAGKGHESTQTIGDKVIAFDDRDEARAALAGLERAW